MGVVVAAGVAVAVALGAVCAVVVAVHAASKPAKTIATTRTCSPIFLTDLLTTGCAEWRGASWWRAGE